MKVSVPYAELSETVAAKTGKNICFEYGSCRGEGVVKFLGVPCSVRILGVVSKSVTLFYNVSLSSSQDFEEGSFFDRVRKHIKRKVETAGNKTIDVIISDIIKHPAISVIDDNTVAVDLEKIAKLNDLLEKVEISDVFFDETGLCADMKLLSRMNNDI